MDLFAFRSIALLLAVATVAGCAAPGPATPIAEQAAATGGRIVSMRPVPPAHAASPALVALGTNNGASGQAVLFEFIVRDQEGRAMSVVQPNELQLRPGDRVTLRRGERTTLVRGPGP